MLNFTGIMSLLLLIPYVGWGIHTLRKRYVLREELPMSVEAATFVFLVLFFAVEIGLAGILLTKERLTHIVAILGLFVSGTALYGPMINNFFSRIIVGLITHGDEAAPDQPRFGPAEALEYHGDDEGALKEYTIIARIYPWNPGVYLRIAEVSIRLKQYEDAVTWLDYGLKRLKTAHECLPLLMRLCDIFSDHLDKPEESKRILNDFSARFPDTKEGDAIRKRLARNKVDFCAQISSLLEDMAGISLTQADIPEDNSPENKGKVITLEALESKPMPETAPKRKEKPKASSIQLEAMDSEETE